MTDPFARLSATTARAVTAAALVGMFALAVHDRTVIGGVLVGLVLAAAVRWFGDSHRRIAVASALVPVAAVGAVAGVGRVMEPTAAVLLAVATLVAVAVGSTVTGWPSSTVSLRAGTAALIAALAAGGLAIFGVGIDGAGGIGSALETALWLTGHGVSGLLGWIVVAGLALPIGLLALPLASFTSPRTVESSVTMRNALVRTVCFGAVIAFVLLSAATVLGQFLVAVASLVDGVAGSSVVRGLIATVALFGVALAALGATVRHSWHRTSGRDSAIVPIATGSVFGATAAFATTVGVLAPSGEYGPVGALFGATAVVLLIGSIAVLECVKLSGWFGAPSPATVIALGLAAGSIAIGTSSESTGYAVILTGLPALVALAAGLFAYDVGRYGRILTREIGLEGVSRRPQLVRIGWSGVVAAVGVPVAASGLLIGTALAPTLSVSATAGALAAIAAIVAGAWLLLR